MNRCVMFRFSDDDTERSALMEVVSAAGDSLTLQLRGIHSLRIPTIANQLWLPELEVVSVAERQWESVRIVIRSPSSEDPNFECYCREVGYVPLDSIALSGQALPT